jgi:hypothetical protein
LRISNESLKRRIDGSVDNERRTYGRWVWAA